MSEQTSQSTSEEQKIGLIDDALLGASVGGAVAGTVIGLVTEGTVHDRVTEAAEPPKEGVNQRPELLAGPAYVGTLAIIGTVVGFGIGKIIREFKPRAMGEKPKAS